MEHLVKMFYRIISGLDALDTTLTSITTLSENKSTSSSSLTDHDRHHILDFPNPDHKSAALTTSSSLTKPELLKHTAESPQDLTDSEIELLQNRYWADPPHKALKVQGAAHHILGDEIGPLMSHLEEICISLYEENKAYALENITTEWVRHMMSTSQAEQAAEDEDILVQAWPWVQRLWDEDETYSIWSYTFFIVPGIDKVRLEDYQYRFGTVI
ncbi:uncharacterized protein DNG_09943 [Cephalotrichum gorgonifer]|uniref:Uncharacterized protein n=1 Tax=Cephalotrichum gorgonifer TaxID=2041049 RepID=A0AAE8N821_9PEZI|nr:uncharacterized protein DNG_09943 [Cephalotrichum gorgonifer]